MASNLEPRTFYRIKSGWLHPLDTRIERDGEDISNLVRAFTIRCVAGERTTIELEVYDQDDNGHKYLDRDTEAPAIHTERGLLVGNID